VFVSSVVEGFEAHRQAARIGIEQAGGEPVLVNEQFPSLASSSRNACLDAIDSCDFFVLVIGQRGGWRTPSGRLVVEEEFEHARSRKLPILVFLENIDQDADARQLARAVSDYVDGFFRVTFRGPTELAREVERSLKPHLEPSRNSKMPSDPVAPHLLKPHRFGDETVLRLVLAPEREEEVFDPRVLASENFFDRVMEIGHAREIRLFSYGCAKQPPNLKQDWWILEQPLGDDWRNGRNGVRLAIAESGIVILDLNVTGRSPRDNASSMRDMWVIAIEDLETALAADFRFIHGLYEDVDKFKRHQRFLWNACLSGMGYRTFERNPKQRNSHTPNMSGGEEPLAAFPAARPITRAELPQPKDEIERAILYWTRQRNGSR
jgi:hypothetical protein